MNHDITIHKGIAYTLIILLCAFSVPVFYVLYEVVNGWGLIDNGSLRLRFDVGQMAIFLLSILVLAYLHELTHALGYVYIGKVPWKDVKVGVLWKSLTPYVHCRVAVGVQVYRMVGLLPVVYGIVPVVIGLMADVKLVYLLGVIMLLASYGDLLMLWVLRKLPHYTMVKDHPSKLGCEIVDVSGGSDAAWNP
ncbi:DUF3267 domain-containing protein [Paenibacillus mendelii]|uniref:DUF3267 domain-containing protein n=1 Tax=Paenibacillus mendelii TaxID=206163 RepID=A0ABV6JFE1_9BACL|nr:DUF3267 domain-containing protein [Paenibacillus mendelii]MCQ6557514.1 DUF3267 domain-containing protein [Paenibacillus mendelii]